MVNNSPPEAEVELEYTAFSPNDDDVRYTVSFTPGIPEDAELLEWDFAVVNEDGDPVMERSGSVISEGTGRGEEAGTGEYRYVLRATDRAGNSATAESDAFLIDRGVEFELEPG